MDELDFQSRNLSDPAALQGLQNDAVSTLFPVPPLVPQWHMNAAVGLMNTSCR